MSTKMPYISDVKLLPRIQKYLDDNKLTGNVNIDLMAGSLQNTYIEYSRKKKAPFRIMVSKAYYVLQMDILLKESHGREIAESEENGNGENIYSNEEMVGKNVSKQGPSKSENPEGTPVIKGQKRKLDAPESIQMRKEKKISHTDVKPDVPGVTFKDMVGVNDIHLTINKDILLWMTSPSEKPFQLGYLLHGRTGCGKTLLAHAIAGNYNLPLMKVAAPELVDGISGNSEKLIRNLFKKALSFSPCVLFIDNLDTITNNTSQKEMQRRMVAQMNSCFDELRKEPSGQKVILIGATSNPDSVDQSLRCYGRFSTEINLDILDEDSRIALLKLHSSHLNLDPNIDWKLIETPGYVGSDLRDIVLKVQKMAHCRFLKQSIQEILKQENEAISSNLLETITKKTELTIEETDKLIEIIGKHGIPEQLKKCMTVTCDDFIAAVKEYKPLSVREGMASVPTVSWDDVGSLKELRKELVATLMGTIKHRKQYEMFGLAAPKGVLLCGPPGCGKTLVAKALANEASLNFILVNGPELLNMYVGESERAVRSCFEKAKHCAPCIIFFDEIDALCPKRGSHGQNEVSSRVVAQMLTAMDGVEKLEGVFILAATNRPDVVDPAILRRGRFDKILYVGLPSADDRVEILKTVTRKITPSLGQDVDLECIGRSDKLSGHTGADLAALVAEAVRIGINRSYVDNCDFELKSQDFEKAICKSVASTVTKKDMVHYEAMKQLYTPST